MTPSISGNSGQIASAAMFQRIGNQVDSLGMAQMESAEDVGNGFESLFMSMLIKELRQTLPEGLFGKEGSDVYGGMFDMYMGQYLAEGQSLGIKDMVTSQSKLFESNQVKG